MISLKKFALEKNKLVVAHRGASGDYPENTTIAVEKAISQGADMIEVDIQITADEEVIVFHDDNLGRTAPGKEKISELKYSEIKNLDAGSWFSDNFEKEKIPLLNNILDIIDGKAYLLLELKSYKDPYFTEKFRFIKQIIKDRNYIPMTLFASFDYNLLKSIKDAESNFNTAGIKIPDRSVNPLELYNIIKNDVYICSAMEYNDEIDSIISDNSLFAGVYGVDSYDIFKKIEKFNIKAYGTNYPDMIRKHLI